MSFHTKGRHMMQMREHHFLRLEEVGISSNKHMMMIEKNNLEIADFIDKWIVKTVR
jgi:hypothetical protein